MSFEEQILRATQVATQYVDTNEQNQVLDIRFEADSNNTHFTVRGLFRLNKYGWDTKHYNDYSDAYTRNGNTLNPDPSTLEVSLLPEDRLTAEESTRYGGKFKVVPGTSSSQGSGLKSPENGQEWEKYVFDFASEIESPAPILTRDDGIAVVSRKAVTIIAGEKGCGKSTVSAMMQAAALSGVPFFGFRPEQFHLRIIAADTEMSPEEVSARYTSVFSAAGLSVPSLCDSLTVLRVRECNSNKRRTLLRDVCSAKRPDMVFLDVVTDFVHNFNDEVESKEFIDELLEMAETLNCAIIASIHTNFGPTGAKAMGHLGSALTRKDSSFLMLTKDKRGNIVVTNHHGRMGTFTKFTFTYFKDGTLHLVTSEAEPTPAKEKEQSLPPVIKRLSEIMQPGRTYRRKELVTMLAPDFSESNVSKYLPLAVSAGVILNAGRGIYKIADNGQNDQ